MYKYLTRPTNSQKRVEHSLECFHTVIIGRSNCGKSYFLLELLRGEHFKKFNAIFLICPTFEINQTYKSFIHDEKFYVVPDPADRLEESICLVRDEGQKYFRSLVIFDDIICTKSMNSRTSEYAKLLVSGRHYGISTITLSQQLNSLPKVARDQFTKIYSFYNANSEDRKILFDTYLVDVTKDERSKIIQHLRAKDYSKFSINVLKGTYKLL